MYDNVKSPYEHWLDSGLQAIIKPYTISNTEMVNETKMIKENK